MTDSPGPSNSHPLALRWGAILFAAAAALMVWPLWQPLVLASWFAIFARPVMTRTSRLTRGRYRAAALVTVLLLVVVLVPIGLFAASLITAASELVESVIRSKGGKQALEAIVSGNGGPHRYGVQDFIPLAKEYGERAMGLVGTVAGATVKGFLGVFVFLLASYAFLSNGAQVSTWIADHLPISRVNYHRYANAFAETGRGLFIGVILTGMIQGLTATVAYLALGIPRAMVLGVLTAFASLIPSVGTALVWIPVALGLVLTGSPWRAGIMAFIGIFVIGFADNLLRPLLSRRGNLQLPTFVLMVSMFGGLATVGAWGLLLGPLLVRLAVEAVSIERTTHPLPLPDSPEPVEKVV